MSDKRLKEEMMDLLVSDSRETLNDILHSAVALDNNKLELTL